MSTVSRHITAFRNQPGEEWRSVPDYPEYLVSSHGRIRSQHRGTRASRNGLLKIQTNAQGYLSVHLYSGGERRGVNVHRIVAEAFLGAQPIWAECVAHNDGDPSNCHVSNLRWATSRENQADRLSHGTDNRGEKHGRAKFTNQQIDDAKRQRAAGEKVKDIAERLGTSAAYMSHLLSGRRWKSANG